MNNKKGDKALLIIALLIIMFGLMACIWFILYMRIHLPIDVIIAMELICLALCIGFVSSIVVKY